MVPRGKIKCRTGIIQCEWENKGSRGNTKGTKAKEENKRLRGETKGAGSAKG